MPRKLMPFLIVMILGAVPAIADEVIHFTNGTSLPVDSHSVDGEMITVYLGDDSVMSFPLEQVDRIESALGEIPLSKGTSGNRIVPRPTPQKTQGVLPPRHRRGTWEATREQAADAGDRPVIERDERGVATYRPYANSGHAGKSKIRVAGSREVFAQPVATSSRAGVIGAKALGTRYVIPSNTGSGPSATGRPTPVGISQKKTGDGGGGDKNEKK